MTDAVGLAVLAFSVLCVVAVVALLWPRRK